MGHQLRTTRMLVQSLSGYGTTKAPHHISLFQDLGMTTGKRRQGKLIFHDRTMFVFHTRHLLVGSILNLWEHTRKRWFHCCCCLWSHLHSWLEQLQNNQARPNKQKTGSISKRVNPHISLGSQHFASCTNTTYALKTKSMHTNLSILIYKIITAK